MVAAQSTGTSAVVIEAPRARVSIEIERMTRGPAKVSVRIDSDDADAAANEAVRIYASLVERVEKLEPTE